MRSLSKCRKAFGKSVELSFGTVPNIFVKSDADCTRNVFGNLKKSSELFKKSSKLEKDDIFVAVIYRNLGFLRINEVYHLCFNDENDKYHSCFPLVGVVLRR